MPSHMIDVNEYREKLRQAHLNELASLLSDEQIRSLCAAPRTHKRQPLARLLSPAGDHHARLVAQRTNDALVYARSRSLQQWRDSHIARACATDSYENAAAALGEIRALGALLSAGFGVEPQRERNAPTPEFIVMAGSSCFIVEVATKQMNAKEAERLRSFNEKLLDPNAGVQIRPGIRVSEHDVAPAGQPSPGENTAENVASKIARIKSTGHQASPDLPSVLWIDFLDEDWWGTKSDAVLPVSLWRNEFYSSGIWHGIYGVKGSALFEGERVQDGGRLSIPIMRHDGMFGQQKCLWSAVLLHVEDAIVLMEHPSQKHPLAQDTLDMMMNLPLFSLEHSVTEYPRGSVSVADQVRHSLVRLKHLSMHAQRGWGESPTS